MEEKSLCLGLDFIEEKYNIVPLVHMAARGREIYNIQLKRTRSYHHCFELFFILLYYGSNECTNKIQTLIEFLDNAGHQVHSSLSCKDLKEQESWKTKPTKRDTFGWGWMCSFDIYYVYICRRMRNEEEKESMECHVVLWLVRNLTRYVVRMWITAEVCTAYTTLSFSNLMIVVIFRTTLYYTILAVGKNPLGWSLFRLPTSYFPLSYLLTKPLSSLAEVIQYILILIPLAHTTLSFACQPSDMDDQMSLPQPLSHIPPLFILMHSYHYYGGPFSEYEK